MLKWFQNNVDQLLGANDITIVFFMLIMGTLVLYYSFHAKFSGKTDLKYMLWGIVTLCYGLAMHRTYWGTKRLANIFEWADVKRWIELNAYVALVPGTLIVFGIVLVISPAICRFILINDNKEKRCTTSFFIMLLFTLCFYWFVFWKISEHHWQLKGHFHKTKITDLTDNANFENFDFENELQTAQWKPLMKKAILKSNSP